MYQRIDRNFSLKINIYHTFINIRDIKKHGKDVRVLKARYKHCLIHGVKVLAGRTNYREKKDTVQ